MAWWETNRVTQRKKLIMEWLSGDFTVTELSRRHDISRDKVYKWIRRYKELGPDGLEDRSHMPHCCPHATDPLVDLVSTDVVPAAELADGDGSTAHAALPAAQRSDRQGLSRQGPPIPANL